MANKKISGYTEKTALDATDWYLIEQSAGTYRKMSSSRLTQVITSDVTYTIGTGGNFADFVQAMAYLKNKMIAPNVTVVLALCSDLALTTPSSYTWYLVSSIKYAALFMDHPCSLHIIIDMAGYDITIGNGTDTCYGFITAPGCTLYMYSSATGSVIKSAKNGYGVGIYAYSHGSIYNYSSNPITIGASGQGFGIGVQADLTGYVNAGSINSYYNNYGFYSNHGSYLFATSVDVADNTSGGFYAAHGSFIVRIGSSGAQASNCSPAVDTVGNYNSFIH